MLLYIHIPFCDSKCNYCAFNSYTHLHSFKDSYMKALNLELTNRLKSLNKKIETVFIGGGTPSTIEPSYYKELLNIIKPYELNKNIEKTIEANPNSANKNWLEEIYSLGINRVSFGVQSFDDDKLSFLARNHNKNQAIEAINNASKIGFKNINCDIIYDTIKDNKELITKDLQIISSLPINHISAYSLTLEEGTKFFNKSNVRLEDEELARYIFDYLDNLGFKQYEISNFALNHSVKSSHNLGYWRYKEYLGVGCGAVGCIDNTRYYNQTDIETYIKDPFSYKDTEILNGDDIKIEKILLALRSEVGFDIDILSKEQYQNILELIKIDKVYIKDDKVFSKDYLLADELALFIDN